MEILIIVSYLLLSVGGLVLIKLGANTLSIGFNQGLFNCSISFISVLGFICYIGSFLIFSLVLVKKFELTYLMPIITGVSQTLTIIAGVFVFKEHITKLGLIGVIAVVLGIILMNIK